MGTRAHTVPKFYLQGFVDVRSLNSPDPFVWIGSLATRKITRKAPKNISTVRSLYDGPGGLSNRDATVEGHLARIENAAAMAIRKFANSDFGEGGEIPPAISRFLAWQAARTPAWMELVQGWVDEFRSSFDDQLIESPPIGLESNRNIVRPLCLEDPKTGSRIEVMDENEFFMLLKEGWKWILRQDDQLELLHIQAWYFQVRHFPRLSWVRLRAPQGEHFITSDRGVAWLVDGYADTPPSALRHPSAQIVAPLTCKEVLIGRHGTGRLGVTPREVNRFIAFAASNWIVGPTREVVERAIIDRDHQLPNRK